MLYFTDFRSIRNFYLMQLGGKFELRCGIQSRDPNFEVIWLKDGQVFSPRRSRGVSFANGNSRIVFNSLLPEDAGFYTCISGGRRYFSRLYMSNPIQQGQFNSDFKFKPLNTTTRRWVFIINKVILTGDDDRSKFKEIREQQDSL